MLNFLGGDEDNGQTSAWYVFSALGFYPVCPMAQENKTDHQHETAPKLIEKPAKNSPVENYKILVLV